MSEPLIVQRARPAVLALKAYSSARSIIQQEGQTVFLDANEMPCEPFIGAKLYSRYAPQQPPQLIKILSELYAVSTDMLAVTRGADEAIDLLIRVFCEAKQDNIIICPPAFPMYAQAAQLQGAAIKNVPLKADFKPDVHAILKAADQNTKIVFLCSPNNPTGNHIGHEVVTQLCESLQDRALVVVDEAYIEFCLEYSCAGLLKKYNNLVILRTLSKGFALAGVRCGGMLAQASIVTLCRKVLAPYPLPVPVVEAALKTLTPANQERLSAKRSEILETRDWFAKELGKIFIVQKVYPSDANFVLARFKDAEKIVGMCRESGFILRNQSHQPGLENSVRITIGTRQQMEDLLYLLTHNKLPDRVSGRTASVVRQTKETAIDVRINLDQADPVHIHTGVGFYDHMLEQIGRHGGFSLVLECVGDLHIDDHHTIEDCAIALGQALRQALGDKAGIDRYGFVLPMDEAQAHVTIDLSGRSFLKFSADFPDKNVGTMPVDMVEHVFRSLAENLQANIHVSVTGENTHHMVEACFKAFGRALRQAIRKQGDVLPSTKGIL